MSRALLLMLWGWTVLWSWGSGRLDLLLRNVFHGLVGTAGPVSYTHLTLPTKQDV